MERHSPTETPNACRAVAPPPTVSTPHLPPEVWTLILIGALDARWQFSARAVCRLWRDVIANEPGRNLGATAPTNRPRSCAIVRASSIMTLRPYADPATLVAFCLLSAGSTRDAPSAPVRPLYRRDVLLGLLASRDCVFVDYALEDLGRCLAARLSSSASAIAPVCNCMAHNQVDSAGGHQRRPSHCLYETKRWDDQDHVATNLYYRRATSVAMRAGGIDLLRRVAWRLDGFDPLRHIDPVDVIAADCVGALALIDPPSGAFWREGYAVALRAFAVPAVWHEAGRADAAAIVARLLDDAAESDARAVSASASTQNTCARATARPVPIPSALRGPGPTMAARVAVVYGNTRVLDVLAARPGIGAVSTARGLDDLARRAASACNSRGFAWCLSALGRMGVGIDIVGMACDAVMGPWIDSGPRVAWDTDGVVRFLDWLCHAEDHRFGGVLATPDAVREISRCAGHPRWLITNGHGQGSVARHARAIATFFQSRSLGAALGAGPAVPAQQPSRL
ncbi:F-box domain containing protein [Pandoravirus salinus]|uniref:F-box domain containing protein n=1 Tax=Pandoravirus salinus TaxID=1349410 RepID=S4VW15_9VIRU|nr:F-box domain [Pandoravirus salinus]AGO84533.2 F-box domain containing protein [Pandoravirus salinus]